MESLKHSMKDVPVKICSDKDIIDFLSLGLNNIIEDVCNIYEESDEESDEGSDTGTEDNELKIDQEEDEEDEGLDYFQDINNNKDVLIKVVDIWLSSKEELVNELEEEIDNLQDDNGKLIEENNNLYGYIDQLLLYIGDINRGKIYTPPKNTICKDGSLDMRVRENKGQQKIPHGQQIMGNSHNSYISHPRCKLCKMSICGRCVKHGG